MPYVLGSTPLVNVGSGVKKFKIGIIADLDKLAKGTDDEGHPFWKSLIAIGSLTYDYDKQNAAVEMHADDESVVVKSSYSRGMRGMELSELIKFGGKFYSVCDKTGIVYDVSDGKAIPRVILANGDGNQESGFKGEWMTRKDGKLLVGSHGREFVRDGKIIDVGMKWIKEIEQNGGVKHVDWSDHFDAMRNAVGCPFPGYMIHESGVWSDVHKKWFFFPRKVSKEPYDDRADETRACNILLTCSEDFSKIEFKEIGPLRPTRGCSSLKFIPGTDDGVIVALKSEEIGDSQKTFITVFTIDGKVILDDLHLADAKYEGLEFV